MKKLLLIVMACFAMHARAQVDESKNFVYLYSDSVIYGKKVMLRPDFYGTWQLRVDSRRIPVGQVKFLNNEDGFFGNIKKLTLGRSTSFSERIIEGKINLFQQTTYDPFLYERGYRYRDARTQAADIRMYYNKGFGDLKKVSYQNLKEDMADNPVSMDLLKSYRRSVNTRTLLYTAAGASLAAGIITFITSGKSKMNDFGRPHSDQRFKSPDYTASFVLFGVGAGLALSGAAVQLSGSRRLEMAVENYNR